MSRIAIPLRHTFIAAIVSTWVVMTAASAAAVVLIRNEQWTGNGTIPVAPGVVPVGLSFDADLTSRDIDGGVKFSIGLSTVDGPQDALLRFCGRVDLPRALWTAHFEVSFSLRCETVDGGIKAFNPSCWMRYVHPVRGTEIREPIALDRTSPIRGSRFELATWDDARVAGSAFLHVDASECVGEPEPITLGIYFDPAGTICQGTIQPDLPGMVYVVAKLDLASSAFAGAEFRFSGVPASWSAFPVANPEIVALGNPLEAGATVAFPCYESERGPLVLYSVLVLAGTEVSDVQFTLLHRNPPTNTQFRCPLLVACTSFVKHCIEGEPCFVNSTTPTPCGEPTAVEPRSWSAVKALYRQSR